MFARTVTVRLKPGASSDFVRAIDGEVAPILRDRKGFQNHFVLVSGNEAIGVSLWDTRESAEAYNRETFPEVQKILSRVTEGTPQVRTYDVASTTLAQRTGARGGGGA
jgi:heme-degrading monooxygenase HmoA